MAETDPRTPYLTQVSLIDTVLGNRDENTVQQTMVDLATQLAATGPLAEAISAIPALETEQAALGTRMTAVESIATSGAVPHASVATVALTNITLSGVQTVSGVASDSAEALAKGVLLNGQSNPAENGVWVPGAGAWTRRSDLDAAGELDAASVRVDHGTYAGRTYWQTATVTTLGTDPIVWAMIADDSDLLAAGEAVQTELDARVGVFSGGDLAAALYRGLRVVDFEFWRSGKVAHPDSGWSIERGLLDLGSARIETVDWFSGLMILSGLGVVLSYVGDDPLFADTSGEAGIDSLITQMDAAAYAASMAAQRGRQLPVARPIWDINHHLTLGQSLSLGQESWPALTTDTDLTAALGIYMLGDSIRPSASGSEGWTPLGVAQLNPAKSVCQSANFGALLDDAAVVASAPGTVFPGETPDLAGLITFQREWLRHIQRPSETTRKFVITSCGVGGTGIAALSPGASPNFYARVEGAIAAVKAAATAAGETYGVSSILFMQGEEDAVASAADGGAAYKAALGAYLDSIIATVMAATGQSDPPAIYFYLTKQVVETHRVAEMQRQIAAERPNVL